MAGERAKITTDRVEQTTAFTNTGQLRGVIRVTFRVGEQGPFFVEVPQLEATPERIKEEQRKLADLVTAVM